jgi:hypothetical protein
MPRFAALIFFRLELVGARPRGQFLHLGADRLQTFLVGLADDRRDEATVGRDRNRDIHFVELQQRVIGPHGVGFGNLSQGKGRGLDGKVVYREPIGRSGAGGEGAARVVD